MREIATPDGRLVVTAAAVAAVAGAAALRCPGVAGLGGHRLQDGLAGLLRDLPDGGRRGVRPGPLGVEVQLDPERCSILLDLVVVFGARLEEVRRAVVGAVATQVEEQAGFAPDRIECRIVGVRRPASR